MPRRLPQALVDAFARAALPPEEELEPTPEEAPPEAPKPPSRYEMVKAYLDRTRGMAEAPQVAPEADVRAAAMSDARRDFGDAMLRAGQAFAGNPGAVLGRQRTNVEESGALSANAARRRALEDWAQAQQRQRLGEAELLSGSMAEPGKKDPELEKRRLDLQEQEMERRKSASQADIDLKREKFEADKRRRAAGAGAGAAKAEKKDREGLAAGWDLLPNSNSTKKQREEHAALVASAKKMSGLTRQMREALLGVGVVDRLNPLGEKRNQLRQLATMISLEAKNVADLGALSGPDYALMMAIAADPTSLQSLTKDQMSVLDQLDKWGENSVTAKSETIGARPATSTPSTPDIPPAAGGLVTIEDPDNPGQTLEVTPAEAAIIKKARGGK